MNCKKYSCQYCHYNFDTPVYKNSEELCPNCKQTKIKYVWNETNCGQRDVIIEKLKNALIQHVICPDCFKACMATSEEEFNNYIAKCPDCGYSIYWGE